MRRLGIGLAVAAAAAMCVFGVAPAKANAPGVGYAKFTVSSISPLGVGRPATVDLVALRGPIVANGKAVNATLDVAPLVGTIGQCESRSCGYVGLSIDLGTASAAVTGTIGDGSRVSGACHGGFVQFSYAAGAALTTTCDVIVRGQSTGSFKLEITAPVGLANTPAAPFIGYFCTAFPTHAVAPCFVPVNVYNPGLTGP